MINLHHNEVTSVGAAKDVLSRTGGILIEIINDNERLLSFHSGKQQFQFDPNRIFTPKGLITNLRKLNKRVSKSAINSTTAFARFILKHIPPSAKSIITLHNNEDEKYSVKKIQPVDMFPHTHHIENVVQLKLKS